MRQWRASAWARLVFPTLRWRLSIGDGRLILDRSDGTHDVGVLQAKLTCDPRARRVVISSGQGRSFSLDGVGRRDLPDIAKCFADERAAEWGCQDLWERSRLAGQAAIAWRAKVEALLTASRWVEADAVDALVASRPDLGAWREASTHPRLQQRLRERDADAESAVARVALVDLDATVAERNEAFLAAEKRDLVQFFANVEKSPLTDQQIRAAVACDNRVRVIAAAGSGKTSTMVARAGYAIRRGIARPDQILALAFNRRAAEELAGRFRARLGDDGAAIASSTFHAFGLRIIGEATGRKPSLPDDLAQDDGVRRLAAIVDALRDVDPDFRRDWDLFRLVFGRHLPTLGEEASAERIDPRSDSAGFATLAGEVAKSQEEVMIANWLFINGVNYRYERPYSHDVADAHHRQYQPDFYYPDIDAWHEHWGIDADGTSPFPGYAESMAWRKETHRRFGTTLLETTSATIRDGSGFRYLEAQLRARGVLLYENPYREIAGEEPLSDEGLVRLMRSFMAHAKGSRLTAADLQRRAGASHRSQLFLRLHAAVQAEWDRRLSASRQVDFEDMLDLAIGLVESGDWKSPFTMVMVDEMQDMSAARARLVRAVTRAPGTRLYAVGDDWQAIYRFAGADLSVMTRFHDWFAPRPMVLPDMSVRPSRSSTVMLDRTFRSPQSLCDVAGGFVSKNPAQLAKRVHSSAEEADEALRVVCVRRTEEYASVIGDELARLDREAMGPTSVLVLGRYRATRDGLEAGLTRRYRHVSVEFDTIHRAKGKEADHVIMPGVEYRALPSMRDDDPVLQLAMSTPDPYPYGEERRLFYVALTRARRSVLLLTRRGFESQFLIELISDGAVTMLSPDGGPSAEICPTCGRRTMIRMEGRFGPFLGCSGYPVCTGKRRIDAADPQGPVAGGVGEPSRSRS